MKKFFLFLVLLVLSGCQSNISGIGFSLGQCCAEDTYQSFSTQTLNMPGFLQPLMVSNFQAVFSASGMNPIAEGGDLKVVLRYEQENISSQERHDDFEGHLAPGGKVRYLAKVWVEMSDAKTDVLVWSGSIQRIHDVDAGEFMHAGKASVALQQAFQNLLASYPHP